MEQQNLATVRRLDSTLARGHSAGDDRAQRRAHRHPARRHLYGLRLARSRPQVPPPLPVQSLIRRIVDIQQATLQGLLDEDVDAIFAALLGDPLVCHHRPDQVLRLWQAMREANAEWLPAWARLTN